MKRALSRRKLGMGLVQIFWQLFPAVLLGALFTVVGVIHVTSRVCVVDIGYRLSSMDGEIRSLVQQSDQLRLEMATLKAPARLEKIAREKLGMVAPGAGAIFSAAPSSFLARPADRPGNAVANRSTLP